MSVVVGYVPTPEGEAALATGLAEAQRLGGDLVVVLSDRGRFGGAVAGSGEEAEALRARLADQPVPVEVRTTARGRNVAEDIVGAAEEAGAVLIVIGLRHRSQMGKLLLGTNAQRILLDAACPVLAVKPT
ncbi:universal stress protein [Isoptericola sp. b441]|uniref:Universal stress protein n=1 Tax=Actinotalea lenta TaxID=3064654 RepID=A0ABT9DEZ7_9CELL|nr:MULTISPECIES: universal stress protein [unclassified Isoptericola]MDO8107937.1 universal stress protein [Isoptericola sp. b441]MDO8120396.1 universal stress protein [Isoptericola sp. b490]